MLRVYDLEKVGIKEQAGDVAVVNEKRQIRIKKIIINTDASAIYVLESTNDNIFKLNAKGDIVQRWGPYASNVMNFMFIDGNDDLYMCFPQKENGILYSRYDKFGKLIGTGLGVYENIIMPFYMDSSGNTYGMAFSKESFLARYNKKENKTVKLPLNYPLIGFEESWTVDAAGNIYYTEAKGDKFKINMLSVLPKGSKEEMSRTN